MYHNRFVMFLCAVLLLAGLPIGQALAAPSAGGGLPPERLSAGHYHSCWLNEDGAAACWGRNDYGQSTPPDYAFTRISVGTFHSCGLKTSGEIACWGAGTTDTGLEPDYGQSIPPAGVFRQVSAGTYHTCALRDSDNSVVCWGDSSQQQFENLPPAEEAFYQVSVGGMHACGVTIDWEVVCWGENSFGQATPPAGTFGYVSAGAAHTCALRFDGKAVCWGAGKTNTGVMPQNGQSISPAGKFVYLDAGALNTCGVRSTGAIICWGAGKTNTGVEPDFGQSIPPTGSFFQVSAGTFHTCGLTSDGKLTCWGDNTYKQSLPFTISGNIHWNCTAGGPAEGGGCGTGAMGEGGGGSGPVLHYTDGSDKIADVDGSGNYAFDVSYDWSGTVTPSQPWVFFTPATRTYNHVIADQPGQDYTSATLLLMSLASIANQDGWVLESTETSGVGGTRNSTATTFRLGDDASNRQYRAVLAFNTKLLPDNAVIRSAQLQIRQNGVATGSNSFNGLGKLWADLRQGPFGNPVLEKGDFNAAASAVKVASFGKTADDGWYTAMLSASGLNKINKTGVTQIRLYFAMDDNNNNLADYMSFSSGNAASGQPQLVINYTLP